MTVAVITHPDCLLHAIPDHPEQPGRVKAIQQAIKLYTFKEPVKFYEAPLATDEQLARAHDEAYIQWLKSIAPQEGLIALDPDTWMNAHTFTAALRAAGSVPLAVDLVMRKEVQAAFCNIRPPGHHAEHDKAMGFCYFNNVAIGVKHALDEYNLKRVAIIDFDVHHGNGTQNIFQYDERVLYCSSFQHPFYPGYEEELDNEHILSVPLAPGTNGEKYREIVQAAWFEKIAAFQPEFVFFSAGFDAHMKDPLAQLNLSEADYVWLTLQIAKITNPFSRGRMVSVLEGGYNLQALAQCVPAHINAMM